MKITRVDICLSDNMFQYFSEAVEDKSQYFYHVNGVIIEITKHEHDMVIKNPKLYYFSTALRLHFMIERKKKDSDFVRD